MLLYITNDDQLINEKKKFDFNVKVKFHFEWKYWMTLHANWIELNLDWNEILKLNSNTLSWIEFQLNE